MNYIFLIMDYLLSIFTLLHINNGFDILTVFLPVIFLSIFVVSLQLCFRVLSLFVTIFMYQPFNLKFVISASQMDQLL